MSKHVMEMALEALTKADKISGYPNNKVVIAALKEAIKQQGEPVAVVMQWRTHTKPCLPPALNTKPNRIGAVC